MIDQPRIVQTTAQHIAFIHLTIPRSEIRHAMGPGLKELSATLAAQGVTPTGPWFTHHLKMSPANFDFEICMPVAAPIAAAGRVQPGVFPAMRAARAVYQGGYEGLSDGWGELMAWIAAEGHKHADDLWEVYITGPESGSDSASYRTELNRPLVD
jgi:effector-binding domain-containing protein